MTYYSCGWGEVGQRHIIRAAKALKSSRLRGIGLNNLGLLLTNGRRVNDIFFLRLPNRDLT